jgi:hypothetical protein
MMSNEGMCPPIGDLSPELDSLFGMESENFDINDDVDFYEAAMGHMLKGDACVVLVNPPQNPNGMTLRIMEREVFRAVPVFRRRPFSHDAATRVKWWVDFAYPVILEERHIT